MIDFHQTYMGKKFYDSDLPDLIRVIERMAKALEESNQLEKDKRNSAEIVSTEGSEMITQAFNNMFSRPDIKPKK